MEADGKSNEPWNFDGADSATAYQVERESPAGIARERLQTAIVIAGYFGIGLVALLAFVIFDGVWESAWSDWLQQQTLLSLWSWGGPFLALLLAIGVILTIRAHGWALWRIGGGVFGGLVAAGGRPPEGDPVSMLVHGAC